MKKIISTIVLLIIAVFTYAQQPSNLDIKHGFNKFDLGATVKDISVFASISPINKQERNLDSYKVNYPSNYKLFGYEPKEIILDFYGGMLAKIYINMPQRSSIDESLFVSEKILDGLAGLYGPWLDLDLTEDLLVKKAIGGEKTALYFFIYKETHSKIKGDVFCYMSIPLMVLSTSN